VAPTRRPREPSPPVIDAGLARDGRPSLRASPAGGTAVRAMLADGLVDELHLLVYPLTRGSGPRSSPRTPRAKAVARGVVYLA
jgi:hypothetical protein